METRRLDQTHAPRKLDSHDQDQQELSAMPEVHAERIQDHSAEPCPEVPDVDQQCGQFQVILSDSSSFDQHKQQNSLAFCHLLMEADHNHKTPETTHGHLFEDRGWQECEQIQPLPHTPPQSPRPMQHKKLQQLGPEVEPPHQENPVLKSEEIVVQGHQSEAFTSFSVDIKRRNQETQTYEKQGQGAITSGDQRVQQQKHNEHEQRYSQSFVVMLAGLLLVLVCRVGLLFGVQAAGQLLQELLVACLVGCFGWLAWQQRRLQLAPH